MTHDAPSCSPADITAAISDANATVARAIVGRLVIETPEFVMALESFDLPAKTLFELVRVAGLQPSMARPCLDSDELAAFIEGRLRLADDAQICAHANNCDTCREVLAAEFELTDRSHELSPEKYRDLIAAAVRSMEERRSGEGDGLHSILEGLPTHLEQLPAAWREMYASMSEVVRENLRSQWDELTATWHDDQYAIALEGVEWPLLPSAVSTATGAASDTGRPAKRTWSVTGEIGSLRLGHQVYRPHLVIDESAGDLYIELSLRAEPPEDVSITQRLVVGATLEVVGSDGRVRPFPILFEIGDLTSGPISGFEFVDIGDEEVSELRLTGIRWLDSSVQ